jgi:hypothetical protein
MAEHGRPKAPLLLTEKERQTLERWARRRTSAQAVALQARIVREREDRRAGARPHRSDSVRSCRCRQEPRAAHPR